MIRAGVAAASLAARAGLRSLLEQVPGVQVRFEFSNLASFKPAEPLDLLVILGAQLWSTLSPDDIDEAQVEAILVLADQPEIGGELASLPIDRWGILPENASLDELEAAVLALGQGLTVAVPGVLNHLLQTRQMGVLVRQTDSEIETLTDRELEVLQLLALGLANKQIAQQLEISAHTVKFHISSIYSKLGAGSRTEAVRLGLQQGLILL